MAETAGHTLIQRFGSALKMREDHHEPLTTFAQ